MKRLRFTEMPMVATLKEADACAAVDGLIRQNGISQANYFQWKPKYSGPDSSELKRIKQLGAENAEPKASAPRPAGSGKP